MQGNAEKEIAQLTHLRDALFQSKQDYWAKQVDVQRQAAIAWQTWAKGNSSQAVDLMRNAVSMEESTYKHPAAPGQLLPARELLGDLLMVSNQPSLALAEYEEALRASPNRFNSLYGAARSAELAGVASKAAAYYRQLLDISKAADSDRKELRQAKLFLARK
jgi:tetratricopeptide (TPR) repeat protein